MSCLLCTWLNKDYLYIAEYFIHKAVGDLHAVSVSYAYKINPKAVGMDSGIGISYHNDIVNLHIQTFIQIEKKKCKYCYLI